MNVHLIKLGSIIALRSLLLMCGLMMNLLSNCAGQQTTPGRSIGLVSLEGDLIVIELDSAVLGQPNLFDLEGRTLRFRPVGSGYRVTNESLRWDSNYGEQLTGADVTLQRFKFPFSGKRWSSFSVGSTGSIRFGPSPKEPDVDAYG